jgi:hypothetical protein
MDMLRVVNNLGQDYDFDQEFINSSREYFLTGDQITVLAMVLSGKLDDAPFVSLFGDEPHWKGGPSAHCLI